MRPLQIRVAVAQEAVELFAGKSFAWGEADCAKLAAFVLRRLGYKPRYSAFGRYRTALAARRALTRSGFADTVDWIDSIHGLARIPFAATLPGDLVACPGDNAMTALAVAVGNGRLLGFHADLGNGCGVLQPLFVPEICWRLAPCRS